MVRNFKIYSLSNFQIYHKVLLTIVTLLYVISPGIIYFITGSLYLLTSFTHFVYPPAPASENHQSVFSIYVLFYFGIIVAFIRTLLSP